MKRIPLLSSLFIIVLLLLTALPLMAESVPKMSAAELLSRLDHKNLVLFDVRTERDWNSSSQKIRGAVRMENQDISIAKQYAADAIYVLYCA